MTRQELINAINSAIPSGVESAISAEDVRNSIINVINNAVLGDNISQSTGNSTSMLMSQDIVTKEIAKKADLSNTIFDDERPVEVTVGGVPRGTVLDGETVVEILKMIFYPANLPYYATSYELLELTPTYPTADELTAKVFRIDLVANISQTTPPPQTIMFPASWGYMTGCKLFNIITSEYEWQYGSAEDSLTVWRRTDEVVSVNGIDVPYNKYEYIGSDRGEVSIEAYL